MATAAGQQAYNFLQENLIFYVNGKRYEVPGASVDPQMPLAEFLHSKGLTGTKIGCSEGGCGACTVMVSSFDPVENKVTHRGVAACLLPLPWVDHMSVTTVEGLARAVGPGGAKKLQAVQEHLAKKHGTQCGFCSPGIVMSLAATSARLSGPGEKGPTMKDMEDCLDGNLCRCTGYRPILEAAHALARDYDPEIDGELSKEVSIDTPCVGEMFDSLLALPDELRQPLRPMRLLGSTAAWYRPVSLNELLDLKGEVPAAQVLGGHHSFPEGSMEPAKLISGNTEIGYQVRYHPPSKPTYPTYVSTAAVAELKAVEVVPEQGIRVGAATTINGLINALAKVPAKKQQTEGYRAMTRVLRFFANNQVRDMGTIGGSLCTCDPLSDLYPSLIAMGATGHVVSRAGARDVLLDDFVLGENRVALEPHEVLLSIFMPYTKEREYLESYKQGKRRCDAQSVVTAGLRVQLTDTDTVANCTLAFGAVGHRAGQRFVKTEEFLTGKHWNEETIMAACAVAKEECTSVIAKSRGLTEYRTAVVPSLLYRFFIAVCGRAQLPMPPRTELTATDRFEHKLHTSRQEYNARWSKDKSLGSNVAHLAATQHVTGAAKFVADEPFAGFYAAYSLTKRGHARLLSVDTTEAMKMPGVHAVYTAADVPGSNLLGSLVSDEEILVSKETQCFGQPGAIVVADTHRQAQAAALKVKYEYEDLPIIGTIKEAIAAKSFYGEEKILERGDVASIFATCPAERIVEGEVMIGGQEHFYIEPMAATVWPSEDKYVVHVTSQNPSKMQRAVASALGIPCHKVESSMERIGGGFGGKQDRPQFLAAACAIAAHCVGEPVRIVLERDQDMQITGQRHEFMVRYKAAHSADGYVEAVEAYLFSNGGCSLDLSPAVMEVALFAIDNCYQLPNFRFIGQCCRTNRPSCTAYRGFGKPQGIATMENIMDHVARNCGMQPVDVRVRNLLHTGDKLLDGEVVDECLAKVWEPLLQKYRERLPAVEKFNSENRFRKRGLALTPAKNNIGFETDWMNQAGALIHVYTDGSVHVSHSGCEMGQGLNTKVAQTAADELGVPLSVVSVGRTGTERVPNTHPTAACTGTDLNVGATIDAARQIREAIAPVREQLRAKNNGVEPTWEEVVNEAYTQRIGLSAAGHFALPQFTYNWDTKEGLGSFYRIYGASLSEVELDVLTGQWRILRTDIIQDNGSGLNPAIDIGQVEGGFVQGLGLFTTEELLWAKDGHLRTRNVSTYKIPSHDDTPIEFNVALLKGVTNDRASKGNKTVGEAGLQLAISVVHAIKHAIYAARKEEAGKEPEFFVLSTPTTVEKVRLACPTPF